MGNILSEKAMLVRLTISLWTARKYDRKVSDEVAEHHNTSGDVGRYNKVLVALEGIKEVCKLANEARNFHYAQTLPWGDDDSRVLPAANYLPYSAKMRELKGKYETAVEGFLSQYPELVEDAKQRLNGMSNEADYPGAGELRGKFGFDTAVTPIPVAADFRVQLTAEELSAIKSDIEATNKQATNELMQDLWNRLYECVKRMSEKLSEEKGIFRDSLVGNVVELCNLLPRLNVLGNGELAEMTKTVSEKLTKYSAGSLREDKKCRKVIVKDANEILKAMSGYVGKGGA